MANDDETVKYIKKSLLWVETQIKYDIAIDAKEVRYVLNNILYDLKGKKDE